MPVHKVTAKAVAECYDILQIDTVTGGQLTHDTFSTVITTTYSNWTRSDNNGIPTLQIHSTSTGDPPKLLPLSTFSLHADGMLQIVPFYGTLGAYR